MPEDRRAAGLREEAAAAFHSQAGGGRLRQIRSSEAKTHLPDLLDAAEPAKA